MQLFEIMPLYDLSYWPFHSIVATTAFSFGVTQAYPMACSINNLLELALFITTSSQMVLADILLRPSCS